MQLTRTPNFGRELDLLFDGLTRTMAGPDRNGSGGGITVPAELRETESSYEVFVDAPGIDGDHLSIEWDDDHLTISGRRDAPELGDDAKVLADERRHGEFKRVVRFAENVDRDNITATYRDGVLHVSVPKVPKPEARRIEIQR